MFQETFSLHQRTNINQQLKLQTSDSKLTKWKFPLVLTLAFLLVHLSVVIMFGEENILYDEFDVYLQRPNPSRWKRVAGSNDSSSSIKNRVPREHIDRTKDDEDKTESLFSIYKSSCRNGHIQGLRSVCLDQPCLRQLKEFHGYPVPEKNINDLTEKLSLEKLQQSSIHRHIHSVQGILDPINFPLISLLTEFQKHLGACGSVGFIQITLDKFSSYLASTVERSLGEKLLVVHSFNASNRPFSIYSASKMPTDKEIYAEHLMELGFSEKRLKEQNSISNDFFLIDDSIPSIPKSLLSELKIPQFRIISLSTDPLDPVSLISGLESAACNIRDGGLVILNFDGQDNYSLSFLKNILENRFGKALSILVATFNKIFITTSNWKNKYTKFIINHSTSLRSGLATFDMATGYYKQS